MPGALSEHCRDPERASCGSSAGFPPGPPAGKANSEGEPRRKLESRELPDSFIPRSIMSSPPALPAGPANPAESLQEFVARTAQRDLGHGVFELESPRFLEVNLNGRMNTKTGSMAAYQGDIREVYMQVGQR